MRYLARHHRTLIGSRQPVIRSLLSFPASFLALSVLSPWGASVISAAPCHTTTTQPIKVSSASALNFSSLFNCEGGDFNVTWFGVVHVGASITIGSGTTVSISGDYLSEVNREQSIASGVITANATQNLSSAVVAMSAFGSLFVVQPGGTLNLDGIAVRNGNSSLGEGAGIGNGGGVYAHDANVTITGCAFEDNFAEVFGGGIFANESRVVVRDTEFRRCAAGFVPFSGQDDADGAGGGVSVFFTDMFVKSCLFENCFASNKAGGLHTGNGEFSMLNSVFRNNRAGGGNEESKTALGQGADLALSACMTGFDSIGGCTVNGSSFINSHTARKGGSVQLSNGRLGVSYVEFYGCYFMNVSTGANIEDDPQGEGGVFSVGTGNTLVLVDSVVVDGYAGKKGGAITLSSGEDWFDDIGGTAILRNSTFEGCEVSNGEGGVIYLNKFTQVNITGDANRFVGNSCTTGGGVISATTDTRARVEGGFFSNNQAQETGGVFWVKGELDVLDGLFAENEGVDRGGVFLANADCVVTIEGGTFTGGNTAGEGGVAYADVDATLYVNGGSFTGNNAGSSGGAFFIDIDVDFAITGGTFAENRADFGGFLFIEGSHSASCVDASIVGSEALDGGAIYAVAVELDWKCDLIRNSALAGPAIYAREESNVTLRGVKLENNRVSRGSVVFLVSSELTTDQVIFNDTSGSSDLSAVQADTGSKYVAQATSFMGFAGEAVVFNEGELVLDDCDFSESEASVLVYTDSAARTTVRNAVLGNKNYKGPAVEASEAGHVPDIGNIVNAKLTCGGGEDNVDGEKRHSPCSDGRSCVEADLGVYCECYVPESTGEETCITQETHGLSLSVLESTKEQFLPELLEGKLILALPGHDEGTDGFADNSSDTSTRTSSTTNMTHSLAGKGVVWNVSAVSADRDLSLMNWTVFPSMGLLLPGENITIWVVSNPSSEFDGSAVVTFRVDTMEDYVDEVAFVQTAKSQSLSSSSSRETSMKVTFYHCEAGTFWNMFSGANHPSVGCELCSGAAVGNTKGLDCTEPGASTKTLPINKGYWRASLDVIRIRECFNEDACVGGWSVTNVSDYCRTGYEGPYCAVCASNYGRGVSNRCHKCTASFTRGMVFLIFVAALALLIVGVLLAAYLIGGMGAVTYTISSTKESVASMRRLGSSYLAVAKSTKYTATSVSTAKGTSLSAPSASGPDVNPSTSQHLTGVRGAKVWAAKARNNSPSQQEGGRANTHTHTHNSMVKRIDCLRSKLPLSRLKIVIVVWQISCAFAEITQVPFPPIYENFLSVIGIFKFDLGWIFSAACIATGITFHLKLLIVTIGPIVILGLLMITFYVGSRPRRLTTPQDDDQQLPVSSQKESSFWVDHPSHTQGVSSQPETQPQPQQQPEQQPEQQQQQQQARAKPLKKPGSLSKSFMSMRRSSRKIQWVWRWASGHGDEMKTPSNLPAPSLGHARSVHPMGRNPEDGLIAGDRRSQPRGSVRGLRVPEAGDPKDSRQDRLWALFSRHTTILLVMLYLVYSSVSTVVFQAFACQPLPEVNKIYLRADFTIECNEPIHRYYQIYATLMIIVYPLGIPAAFLFFLIRQRSAINPALHSQALTKEDGLREKLEVRQTNPTVAPTSFLWGAYLPNRYYYEVFECIRRLLMTGILVFIIPYTTGQVAISCIFSFLSLLGFEFLRPFVDPVDMQLYRTGCLIIFLSNFFALMIKSNVADPNSGSSTVYSVALIAVHTMLFLSVWWNTWQASVAILRNDNTQDVVLGFEIVAQDELDTVFGKQKVTNDNNGGSNSNEMKSAEQELEELEAPPAWEREGVSTAQVTSPYKMHVVSRDDAILATGGMVAGRLPLWKGDGTRKKLSI